MTDALTHLLEANYRLQSDRTCFVVYDGDGAYHGLAYGIADRDRCLREVMLWTHKVGSWRLYSDVVGILEKTPKEIDAECEKWQAAYDRAEKSKERP